MSKKVIFRNEGLFLNAERRKRVVERKCVFGIVLVSLMLLLASFSSADQVAGDKQMREIKRTDAGNELKYERKCKKPEDLPDLTESSKLQKKMPGIVRGRVLLEGQGLEGVRITDGVHYATTDSNGCYSIEIKPDPLIPYLPSRTVSMSWPDGTWPAKKKDGSYCFYRRLMDIENADHVNFELVQRKLNLPICVGFGTDPHDQLSRPHNRVFSSDIAAYPGHVAFSVMGGDLSYAEFKSSDAIFKAVQQYTRQFPVMLLHCIGNHDIVGGHTDWFDVPHETACYGGFTKWLNPVRWSFDCAGVRFIGIDYGMIDTNRTVHGGISDTAIDWLERDLASKPKETPGYLFVHQSWSPDPRFYELCEKNGIRLSLCGDSHRSMFLNNTRMPVPGQTQYWSKMSLYTRLYIQKSGFDIVDVCIYRGGRNGWDGAWHHERRECALYNDGPEELAKQRDKHTGLENIILKSEKRELAAPEGDSFDLRFGAKGVGANPAGKWGLRVIGKNGVTNEFSYDSKAKMVHLMGLDTPFDPVLPEGHGGREGTVDPEEQKWVEIRIFVMPDMVRAIVNSRLHYLKQIRIGDLKRVEFFSEGGSADFGRVDSWRRIYKDYKPKIQFNSG